MLKLTDSLIINLDLVYQITTNPETNKIGFYFVVQSMVRPDKKSQPDLMNHVVEYAADDEADFHRIINLITGQHMSEPDPPAAIKTTNEECARCDTRPSDPRTLVEFGGKLYCKVCAELTSSGKLKFDSFNDGPENE